MTVPSATDDPLLKSDDLELLADHTCNVVLEGPATAVDVVLRLLQSRRREPIGWHHLDASFKPGGGQARTLVLRDASALDADAQRRLHAWIGEAGRGTQIIATTERPLFPLVAAGLFDAGLYYRLNLLLLRIGPDSTPLLSSTVNDDARRVTTD